MDALQGLLEASPDAVVVADRAGEITRANDHVEAVLGYAPAELEGMELEDLLHPDDRETYRDRRRASEADPEPRPIGQAVDLSAQRADGTTVPVEINIGPIEIDGERRVVATITDVSEREARLEALRESEERYRRLLDISPAPIVIYDAEGVIRYANEAAANLLDLHSPEAMLGDPAIEYIHEDDREASAAGIERVIEEREPVARVERRLVTPDGAVRHVILSSAPITVEDEPAAQVLLSDVTPLKEREQALERQNERLEEFASIVSHDLRNPLTVLESSLDLLRESSEDEHFDRAERAVDRMNRLVEDLLTIARHGRTPDETEAVDLRAVAEEAWGTVETADADLEIDAAGTVEAERTRLLELFENLFRNAVEHGATDGAVSVRIEELENGFAVADDGVGIPAGEREAILERGYSTADHGTGYGLAIVQEIVDAHDWELRVDESEAGGATFVIETG